MIGRVGGCIGQSTASADATIDATTMVRRGGEEEAKTGDRREEVEVVEEEVDGEEGGDVGMEEGIGGEGMVLTFGFVSMNDWLT